jgi:hypothetical protein
MLLKKNTVYRCRKRASEKRAEEAQIQNAAHEEHANDAAASDVEDELQGAVDFAREVLDQVVRKRIKPAGVTDMLKLFKRYYGKKLPTGLTVPKSWHTVKKLASDGKKPKATMRHLCPNCDKLFPLARTQSVCTRCKEETRWDPLKRSHTILYYRLLRTLL